MEKSKINGKQSVSLPKFEPFEADGSWRQVQDKAGLEALAAMYESLAEPDRLARERAHAKAAMTLGCPKESSAAKTAAIAAMAGERIRSSARAANAEAVEYLASDDSVFGMGVASAEFADGASRLLRALGEEVCRSTVVASEPLFNKAAVDKLMRSAAGLEAWPSAMVDLLRDSVEAKALAGLDAWMSMESTRTAIKASDRGGSGDGQEFDLEGCGFYAPLLAYLNESCIPSMKMEMAARFEIYLRSGHAAADLFDLSSSEEDPKRAGKLGRCRQAFDGFKSGSGGAVALGAALAERMADLMVGFTVVESQANNGKRHKVDRSKVTEGVDPSRRAGSGQVDVAMPSLKEPGVLLAAFATSDEFMSKQGDQWYAHKQALEEFVRSEPSLFGQAMSQVRCFVRGISCMPQGASAQGGWGGDVFKYCAAGSNLQLSEELREVAAMAPFMARVFQRGQSKGFGIENALDLDYRIFGGSATSWNEMKQAAISCADQSEGLAIEAAAWWGKAVSALTRGLPNENGSLLDSGKEKSATLALVGSLAKMGDWLDGEAESGSALSRAAARKAFANNTQNLSAIMKFSQETGLRSQFKLYFHQAMAWEQEPESNVVQKGKPKKTS